MWAGRLNGELTDEFMQLNHSLPVDARLVQEDINGSIAWVHALTNADVLSPEEAAALKSALYSIKDDAGADPESILLSGEEDIHSWVESELVKRLGPLGKKLHTGRSRNDQVATDLRLWTRKAIAKRIEEMSALQETLIHLGRREETAVMPGYTHLQRAQPILFAHWCLAYFDMLARDQGRFDDARRRLNRCPLGSGALSGTAYPINRAALAKELGFDGPTTNSLDAVSDRDFVVEALSAIALCAIHLSRLAEDIIFFATSEAGFVELADSVCTGSSMMPQKKNPDALELIRGKSGGAIGSLMAMCVTLKGLPLSYNKDLQEDKALLFRAMDDLSLSLRVSTAVLAGLKVNRDRSRSAARNGYSNATELADSLARQGVPFRDAHAIAGRVVRHAIDQNLKLESLSGSDLHTIAPEIPADFIVDLTIDAALRRRDVIGGTAPGQVKASLDHASLAAGSSVTQVAHSDCFVEQARVEHLDDICRLVDLWAAAGENLPRSRDEILNALSSFAVAVRDQNVIGCGSLFIYSPTLAEIRSLGVDPRIQRGGVGSRLVEFLLESAKRLQITRVFALTRAPKFFQRNGFRVVSVETLPEKVFKDCVKCSKRECCDEIAVIIELKA